MRILLTAGGFSAGGIADYSLLLARELQDRGCEIGFLALAEPGLEAAEESQVTRGRSSAPLLRLPAGRLERAGIERARAWIAAFDPDWLSLQFNPFSFNPRGLLWGERPGLARLLRGLPIQVMVHEIWVGIADQKDWKPRLVGCLQRPAIVGLLRDLRPRLLHTSNPYFQDLLGEAGLAAALFPLFGNIPVAGTSQEEQTALLGEAVSNKVPFRLGLFSGQRGERLPDSLIEALRDHAAGEGRRLAVYSAGRAPGVEALFERWRDRHPEVGFTALGELSTAQLSCFMQAMDAALTHYPYYLCGKSGAAAAWLEHGVPLLTAWGDLTPGEAPVPPDVQSLLRRPEEPVGAFLARQGPRRPRGHRLPEAADQLLEEMEAAAGR